MAAEPTQSEHTLFWEGSDRQEDSFREGEQPLHQLSLKDCSFPNGSTLAVAS